MIATMAKHDSAQDISITKERSRLALQASLEIEQISKLLRHGASVADEFGIRGVCMRIENLAETISMAIADDEVEMAELATRLGADEEFCHE